MILEDAKPVSAGSKKLFKNGIKLLFTQSDHVLLCSLLYFFLVVTCVAITMTQSSGRELSITDELLT